MEPNAGDNDETNSQPPPQEPGPAVTNDPDPDPDPAPQEQPRLKGIERIKADIARREEKRRQFQLRLDQMPPDERAAYLEKRAAKREKRDRVEHAKRRKAARQLDLIEIALGPDGYLTYDQSTALLRQPYYPPDGIAFLRSLNGYLDYIGDMRDFRRKMMITPDDPKRFLLRSPELCKFALVDWRIPSPERIQEVGPSLTVEHLYQMYQGLPQDDRLAQARVIARRHPEQYSLAKTQCWARKILDQYKAAVEGGEPLTDQVAPHVWANITPKAPA